MFEKFTEKAKRVLFFARYEASQLGSPYIEPEHLLLGLVREDKNLLDRFLSRPGLSLENVRKEIERRVVIREKVSTSIDLPFSNEAKNVLNFADEEAERLKYLYIGTEHLLLGLLRGEKSMAATILSEKGLRLSVVREEMARSHYGVARQAKSDEIERSQGVTMQIKIDELARSQGVAMLEKIQEAVRFIKERSTLEPKIGFILGSGLGDYAEQFSEAVGISFADIPNFPQSHVEGHAGRLVLGLAEGTPAVAMQGRVHYYEGHPMRDVTFPVRVMGLLGIKALIVTNAAGGINKKFSQGVLMVIKDHINMMGSNPLIGPHVPEFGQRFPDMTEAYDQRLCKIAEQAAEEIDLKIATGVYVGLHGPSYETPAEIRMLGKLGADAVGMSTVPEVIVANQMGIKVLGISCITNMAAGILNKKLDHSEVLETTQRVRGQFIALLKAIVPKISGSVPPA
jgi:purine-nucleoside phosphorylase